MSSLQDNIMTKYIQLTVRLRMTNAVKSHQMKQELKMGTCKAKSQEDPPAAMTSWADMGLARL